MGLVSKWESREGSARRAAEPAPEGFCEWNALRLARELKAAGVEVTADLVYAGPLAAACGRAGVNPDDLMPFLVDAWAEAADPGKDVFSSAVVRADRLAGRFARPDRSRGYARAAALAYVLHLFAADRPTFAFPRGRLAAWLAVTEKTAGRLVRQLAADGVIRLGADWSYRAGYAREAAYTGQ